MGLYDELMLRFPGYKDRPGASTAFDDDLDDVPSRAAREAAFELLCEDPRHLPNGIEVRRRVYENLGLLAPSFAEAERLLADVNAGRLSIVEVSGPVRVFARADVAPFRRQEAYDGIAREHNRRVLAPGGLALLREAGVWVAACDEARLDRPALMAVVDGPPVAPPVSLRGLLGGVTKRAADL